MTLPLLLLLLLLFSGAMPLRVCAQGRDHTHRDRPGRVGTPPQSFSLKEVFGVSHPEQIIDFDGVKYTDPKSSYLIGPDGAEVPYQLLRGGRIAVRTDLPANSSRTWRLMTGRAPLPVRSGVTVEKGAGYYEITNGLTGVRVPLPVTDLKNTPAPVQGILLRDGRWTAIGPNLLSTPAGKMEVRFAERGPLEAVVEVVYRISRPAMRAGDRVVAPAGGGYYKSTITVQAGQPSLLFEEETDADVSYSVNVYDGLSPTHARYRGHRSGDAKFGREADGRRYEGNGLRDAFLDLSYERPKASGSETSDTTYKRITPWDAWAHGGGWYWMLYNDAAPYTANLLGVFAGRASRAVGAASSGVGIFTTPTDGGKRAAGLTVTCARRADPHPQFRPPHVRFAWGLYVGTKGADLLPPDRVQPIGRQWNLHAGINLNKIHRIRLDYPDPKRGYGSPFIESVVRERIIARLRADKGGPYGSGYHNRIYHAEPYARELIDIWASRDAAPVGKAVAGVAETARDLLNALVNDKGIFHSSGDQTLPSYSYWMGGLQMASAAIRIDQVLADKRTPPAGRAKAKAAAALFAHILWDDDFSPLQPGSGINLGNPNMPVMQRGFRDFFTLFLSEHPAMRPRVSDVEKNVRASVHEMLNEHGASFSAVHYVGAGMDPTLNTLLQLRMLGKDHFKTEPRLRRFADFYLNFLTPPETRFGGVRKVISVGDGSTEGSTIFGTLASGFRTADPGLSARLMGAWVSNGRPHSGSSGTTLLKIDENAPAEDPALGSATFPGYYSVLRHGWGTKNETALWLIDGDFYHDHRHVDHGSVALYALGAPLSLDWGATYSPQVPGAFLHNKVVPEASIGSSPGGPPPQTLRRWDEDNTPLDTANFIWGQGPWIGSTQEAFAAFAHSSYARARFASPEGRSPRMVWTRAVYSIHPDPDRPILVIRDRFAGDDAGAGKVFTLNLMAQGDVETPSGKMSPPLRLYDHRSGDTARQELPSAGAVFPLPPGLNRLGFTGQWLIDWDLYTLSDEAQQAHVGNWGHNWHPGTEQAEFQKANARPFEERQHILRIRGNGGFTVLLLPFRKGERPDDLKVTREGAAVLISRGSGTSTRIDAGYSAFRSARRTVLCTYTDAAATAYGIFIRGGPAEVAMEDGKATITLHGSRGARRIKLPGKWKVLPPARRENGEIVIDFPGGAAVQAVLSPD